MNSIVINPKALQCELFMTFFASRKVLNGKFMLDPCVSPDEFIIDLKEVVPVKEGRNGFGLGVTQASYHYSRMSDDARLRSTHCSDYCNIFLDWLYEIEDKLQLDIKENTKTPVEMPGQEGGVHA